MGQYYAAVNLDKKQFISPHEMNDLAKAKEFGSNPCGMMTGIVALIGSGDWGGDTLAILGDYTDAEAKAPGGMTWREKFSVAEDLGGQPDLYRAVTKSPSWVNVSKRARHLSYKTGNVESGFASVNTKKLGERSVNHVIFNQTNGDLLDPKNLGDFLSWEDFAVSPTGGILSALAGLLVITDQYGGSDYNQHALIGAWACNKIIIRNASSVSGKDISSLMRPVMSDNFGVKFKELDSGEYARYTYYPKTKREEWICSDGIVGEGE